MIPKDPLTSQPRSSLPTDEELCCRVVRGESELFAEIVARHQSSVFRCALRATRNHHDAEELTQEVLLRAYRGLDQFSGTARFSTWLARITINQINSFFSSAHTRQKMRCDVFDQEQHGATSATHSAADAAMIERLILATASLKPVYRSVLILCGFEGYPYDEAAEILGVPVGTVRSRLNTARLELRRIIGTELS